MTDTADKWGDAVRAIAQHPGLRAEVERVAPELQARAKRADPADILAALIELAPVYGISDRTDDEWATLFDAYIEALAPLPIEAIRAGIVEWNREGEFFPKPGQIFQRADAYAKTLYVAAYRAKKSLEWVDRNPPPKTDADRAADRQRLIDAGLMTPDGKFAPLQFRKIDRGPSKPQETPQEMADRLRRLSDGTKAIETQQLPDEPGEAI